MKTILAYGDSLTYGHNAEGWGTPDAGGGRHAFEDRWPSVLEAGLGGRARVIPEGLGGRTTAFDDWSAVTDRNGARVLPTILGSHMPLDAVVIMLGTNDLKTYLNGSAFGAAMGVKRLVEIIRTFPYAPGVAVPQVVIVAPPRVVKTRHRDLSHMFANGLDESALFGTHYARVAEDLGCAFFDAATVATATELDGVHLDAENTRAIGTALVPVVSKLLGL
ncbi:arylesterase [Arsenicitalea aurantiaca]|uniref:Arylesterase n=1 Tax=Arsenicitalea aurantiaca TaxID=1783274 RepID=A0A433XFQ6_9HYPH|nr:SGNH/GDSL hydrolase family protein [Arsenicitalea aurantiaca]RUT32890.1 arylesterase [Arsenicitalea aurantiaca]